MGMGPAKEAVEETVEFGKEIVCSISADLTISKVPGREIGQLPGCVSRLC